MVLRDGGRGWTNWIMTTEEIASDKSVMMTVLIWVISCLLINLRPLNGKRTYSSMATQKVAPLMAATTFFFFFLRESVKNSDGRDTHRRI